MDISLGIDIVASIATTLDRGVADSASANGKSDQVYFTVGNPLWLRLPISPLA